MTKKEKILNKLSEKQWYKGATTLTYEDFKDMNMCPTIEYGERYCDVIYARRIIQKEGYKVLLGSFCLYVYQQ